MREAVKDDIPEAAKKEWGEERAKEGVNAGVVDADANPAAVDHDVAMEGHALPKRGDMVSGELMLFGYKPGLAKFEFALGN
jgi:hypothetical protein